MKIEEIAEKLRIIHCSSCGGTGQVFSNVPGSIILRTNMIPQDRIIQPYATDCGLCKGTGHLIHTMEG